MELIVKLEQLWLFLMFFGLFGCLYFFTKMPTWLSDKEIKKGFFRRKSTKDFLCAFASGAIGIFGEAMLIPIIYGPHY